MKKIVSFAAALSITVLSVSQNTYTLDKNHSQLQFSVMHFGISHVEGNFKTFDVKMNSSKEDFSDATIEMTADVSSINTGVDRRDTDLKGPSWFDVEKYPKIIFRNDSFEKISSDRYKLKGTITMHGVTKPITLDVVYNGKVLNPMTKKYSIGFTITGKLNRNDFGIGKDPSSVTVGDEVEVKANVEFIMNM
jgi:polyisoprenoid-binding protein YceI